MQRGKHQHVLISNLLHTSNNMIATIKTSPLHKVIIFFFILFLTFPSFLFSLSSSSSSPSSTSSIIQSSSHSYTVPRGSSITIILTDIFPFSHDTNPHHPINSPHPTFTHHPTNHPHPDKSHLDTCLVQVDEDEEWLRVGNLLPKVCVVSYYKSYD